MATYKLEINKKYGKFFFRIFKAGEEATESDAIEAMDDLLKQVADAYDDLDLGPNDDVIFRGIAYNSYQQLKDTIRTAPF